jgi:porin
VVGGGKNGAWEYGGRGDLILNLDSGKLGLWPGGFFNFEMEGNWASAVNPKTGALMPVNVSQTVPLPPGGIFGVPAWNFTQFFPSTLV